MIITSEGKLITEATMEQELKGLGLDKNLDGSFTMTKIRPHGCVKIMVNKKGYVAVKNGMDLQVGFDYDYERLEIMMMIMGS